MLKRKVSFSTVFRLTFSPNEVFDGGWLIGRYTALLLQRRGHQAPSHHHRGILGNSTREGVPHHAKLNLHIPHSPVRTSAKVVLP
jgi:hypothetical protein